MKKLNKLRIFLPTWLYMGTYAIATLPRYTLKIDTPILMTENKNNINRGEEITKEYFAYLDQHIEDVVNGQAMDFLELNQIAKALHVSHSHLSDTLQQETGNHPCYFYDLKIIDKAKSLLANTNLSIAEIAKKLTYDPSNFGKFFKKFTGQTAGEFRKVHKK